MNTKRTAGSDMINKAFHQFRDTYYIFVLGFLLSAKLMLSPSLMQLQYRPSSAFLLSIIGTVLILYSFWFLFRKSRGRFVYAFVIYTLASLLIVTQIVYIRYFTRPVSMHVLLQFGNLNGLGDSVWSLVSAADLFMLADIPVLFVFFFRSSGTLFITKRKIVTALCLLTGTVFLLMPPAYLKFVANKPLLYPWSECENLLHYNIVEYQFIDFFITLKNRTRLQLGLREKRQVREWLAKNREYQSFQYRDTLFGAGKKKNIIVIQCEALGNFVVNKIHNRREITPNINRLIKDSLYFSHHHCQNFHGGSSDAELILFTSLFPLLKGSTFFRYPANYYPALPALLKEEGFTTAAIHGNRKSFWNRGQSYPFMGIDEFHDSEKMFGKKEWVNDDELVFSESIDILKNLKKPFFSIIITIETHLGADLINIEGYFDAIHKLDKSVGNFIARLKTEGLYDESVIILYGDHIPYLKYGEIIEKDKSLAWIQTPGREVPFIMHIPGVTPAVISRITAHVDAYPAIAYIMGIDSEKYSGHIMGKNMITTKSSYALTYPDAYISDEKRVDPAELRHRKSGFTISDLIIQSDFFAALPGMCIEKKKQLRREMVTGNNKKTPQDIPPM